MAVTKKQTVSKDSSTKKPAKSGAKVTKPAAAEKLATAWRF